MLVNVVSKLSNIILLSFLIDIENSALNLENKIKIKMHLNLSLK